MESKNNSWQVVDGQNHYGYWLMEFPHLNVAEMLSIMTTVLEIGKRESICMPIKTRLFDPQKETYPEYNKRRYEETSWFSFFKSYSDKSKSRIAYYDSNHQIIEDEVSNINNLLRQLRPDIYLKKDTISPVSLNGSGITKKEIATHERKPFILIQLFTDIWFPVVLGHSDDWSQNIPISKRKMISNHELASQHTPRLNRFLQEVRQLTLQWNGTWKADKHLVSNYYQPYLTETSIKLDDL